ncbi:hypothetical protein [Candidatus Ruminimicrobiellum ovillum]|uniref:hypothetical protein n=1 Tax=Candidatus Ruminimicrobiellum ovillum TaxID=1947927 RepID=UPI00355AA497
MKNLFKSIFIFALFILPTFCFAENTDNNREDVQIKTIDRENYQVQIKQYNKEYPVILYVVFKESTPLLDEIRKILRTELVSLTKTRRIENDIVASAWFDNQVSDDLEKIELTNKYGAFVRIYDKEKKKEAGTVSFPEYLKYLKKKKEEDKNKDKQIS